MKDILQQAKWANFDERNMQLNSFEGPQPIQMKNSDGTALSLILDKSFPDNFGADIIRFEAGKGVALHKHCGSHILMVTKGRGTLTYNDEKHIMYEGMIYLVPSSIPHAIDAITELVLIAIGNVHQSANSEERIELLD